MKLDRSKNTLVVCAVEDLPSVRGKAQAYLELLKLLTELPPTNGG